MDKITFEEAKTYCQENGFSMVPNELFRKLCTRNAGPLIITGKYIDIIRAEDPDASMILGCLQGDKFENLNDELATTIFFKTEKELEKFNEWLKKVGKERPWEN